MSDSLPPVLTPGSPLFALGYAQPLIRRDLQRFHDADTDPGDAMVAEEVPVAFAYNLRPHVVMMATPSDLEDFALGFSLAEGIIHDPGEILATEVVRYSEGIELQMRVAAEVTNRLDGKGRQFIGRTGCGLCGVETIQAALRPVPAIAAQEPIDAEALWRAEAALGDRQVMNRDTGTLHAAAWAHRDGAIEVVREDVGRHNALDKVIGALARAGIDPSTGFVVMTSRASYELVQKAATAGVPLLAAISRPTGLAIRLAQASGMTLVGLLRGRSANVYAGSGLTPQR